MKVEAAVATETVQIEGTSRMAPDVIWSHVQDFARAWHPMVDWMELEAPTGGAVIRRFTVKEDTGYYREQLTYLSHSERTMAYTCLEGIKGAKTYNAKLTVAANGAGGSTINWQAEIEAEGSRASEIAEGTGFIFKAGIDVLKGLDKGHQIEKTPDTDDQSIETVLVDSQRVNSGPKLALSVAPQGLSKAEEICILLHGIGGNRTNWDNQLSALASLVPMVAMDLRGYGDSALGTGQSTVEDYCNEILAIMAKFKAGKVVICGLSYGAWIATSFALAYPNKVTGLVLCGGCTGMSEAATEERQAFLASREVPLSAGQTPADFAPQVVEAICGPNADDAVRRQLIESMAQISVSTYRDALNCFCNPAGQFDFSGLACPVLLMTGEHDKLAPPAEIEQVAKRMHKAISQKATSHKAKLENIDGAFVQYEMIADAGHVCNLENPGQLNNHLRSFLSRIVASDQAAELTPKQKRQQEKRERIMSAALKEFSVNGYSGASMQAIADRAKVSKPTLYQYVGQKDTIFKALLSQGKSTILAPFANADDRDMVEVLWEFSWTYADFVLDEDNLSIARLVIGEAERVPEVALHFYENGPAQALSGIAEYLESKRSEQLLAFDDSAIAADNLWSLIFSGPRNRLLYFPHRKPAAIEIRKNIVMGLRAFLCAYACDQASNIETLNRIVQASEKDR